MQRLRVLITSPPFLDVVDRYEGEFRSQNIELILKRPGQFFKECEMRELIRDIDGIICGDDEITDEVLGNANRLSVISKWGVGTDSIDLEAAARHRISVCNSRGAFKDACADVAMGYLIMLARGLLRTHTLTKRGKWEKLPGVLLRGRTLGIVGVGNIGRETARRAVPFGLRILGNDIRAVPDAVLHETGMEMTSKNNLFAQSDFLLISCDLNPGTLRLIDAGALKMMKRSAYLINVARGAIVDMRALVEALRDGEIAGAALDVFEHEPLHADSPLRLFGNCILGAHNAYNADKAVEFVHRNTVDNLLKHLRENGPGMLEHAVEKALIETGAAARESSHVF